MATYEPMLVEISEEPSPDGVKLIPSPAFDASWSRIDYLRWRAGCIKARTGVDITFDDESEFDGDVWPQVVGITVASDSYRASDPMRDIQGWVDALLTGIEAGALAGRPRKQERWEHQDTRLLKMVMV